MHLLDWLALKRQILQHFIYLLCLLRIVSDINISIIIMFLDVERNWRLRWGTL